MRPIIGFMHVAQMNHWKSVLEDQVAKIGQSGLLEASQKIYVVVLGGDRELGLSSEFLSKSEVIFLSPRLDLFEFPTLQKLQEVAEGDSYDMWYIHTKGVSLKNCEGRERWRKFMEHFVVDHWSYCRFFLRSCDVSGVLWGFRERRWIFVGNFWWARSEYVRNLPPVGVLNWKDRFSAEDWIGLGNPRVGLSESYAGLDLSYWPDFKGPPISFPIDGTWCFDEDFYLSNSPDVARAVAARHYKNGYEHYRVAGWREYTRKVRFENGGKYSFGGRTP